MGGHGPPDAELGARLKSLRLERGLRQRDLAEPKCRAAYVSQIEAGLKTPSRDVLEHFAERLQVDVDELLTGRPTGLAVELEIRIQEARIALYGGDLVKARQLFESARSEANRYWIVSVEAKAEEGLATIAERNGDIDGAREGFERVQSLLEDDLTAQVDAVCGAARCFHMGGDSKYAVHVLEQYVFELRRQAAPDPTALMRALASLSYFYLVAGFAEQAVARAEEARLLEPRSGDPEKIACMNINVARILLHERREGEALRALGRAEDVFRTLDWKIELARSLIAQGFAYAQKEDYRAAEVELNRALDVLVEAPSKFDQAATLTELGRVLRLSGDVETAKQRLQEGLELLEEGDLPERALTYRELALTVLPDRVDEAIAYLQTSADLYRAAGKPVEVAVTMGRLAEVYRDLDDSEAALRAYEEAQLSLEALASN